MALQIEWSGIVQLAGALLALIGGVGSVKVVAWLKDALNLSGRYAQLATAVVAVAVALLTLVVSGAIAPQPLTADYLVALFVAALTASQAEYQRIKATETAKYG